MCVYNYRDEYTIQFPVFYMYGLLECHVTLISHIKMQELYHTMCKLLIPIVYRIN